MLTHLVGRRFRLTTTGHSFKVLYVKPDKVEVLDGRTRRWLPADLLRDAEQAGLLVEDNTKT